MDGGMKMLNSSSPDGYREVFSGAETGFTNVSKVVGFKIPDGFFKKYATPPGDE